ncbi:MAG: hypothetical protein IPH26_05350 [Sterolibacteriaceae bacterium]|uniref:Peptidase M12B domain-containing protein n=1 Tax=Candidatus Methylophosphatis roskildensis TaxID=2899263 RepID=A0A9D7E293_9PROT|nr:hypothetical protein [Candidatus Methylophosphatis roskildensis]
MFRSLICLIVAFAVVLPAHAQSAPTVEDLVAPADLQAGAAPAPARGEARSRARIDRRLVREMAPGRRFGFTPPGGTQRHFVVERTVDHANGDRTVVGRLVGGEVERRAIVTTGVAGTVGRVETPDGRFVLRGSGDALEITDRKASGRRVAPPARDDDKRPPQAARLQANGTAGSNAPASPPAAYAAPVGNSVIDLMVLASPKMSSRYPGALLQTRINNLIEIANQAYIASSIAITLRVVRVQQVAYGDAQSLDQALDDLTSGSGALSGVAALRTQYGADLVSLIRPYDGAVDSGCGMAWVLDYVNNPVSFSRAHAMSVVADGDDLQAASPYYCPDTALVHEIGHNLGSAHDRGHSSSAGTYPYSYGYGFDSIFGTIMSYIDPGVELFSNPRITACVGRPCGVTIGSAGEADNATSMNNVRATAASFVASIAPPTSGLNDLLVDFGPGTGLWLRRNDSAWEAVHGVAPQQMAAGDLDNNGRSDVLIDFGSPYGIWAWRNGTSWSAVHGSSSTQIVATDLDNNGVSDFVINFGPQYGLWVRRNDASWSLLHGVAPRQVVSANLDSNPRRDLIVDFGPSYGIWLYLNDSNWVALHGTSARNIVAGDLDGNGIDEIIVDFGPQYGLWVRMNQTSWVALHGVSPQRMVVGNLDADARKDLVVDFGSQYGIWVWKNNSTWQLVHGVTAEALAMADLDRNGTDDLIVDFGPRYGLWAWKNGTTWAALHGSSPRKFIAVDVDGQ